LRRLCHGAAPRPPAALTTPWQRWWRDNIFSFAGGKKKDPDLAGFQTTTEWHLAAPDGFER